MRHAPSGLSLADFVQSDDTAGFLRQLPFLKSLQDAEVLLLVRAAEQLHFDAGHVVLREGDTSDAIYIVQSGSLEVLKHAGPDPDTASQEAAGLAIHRIERGSVFGEMSFVDGDTASATIRAAEACHLLRLSHEALNSLASATGVPILDRLNGAVAQLVIHRLRRISDQHVEALQRELREVHLRHAFERFFIATMVLFAIASLVQRLIQGDTSPWPHMAFSWGFLLLSVAPMAWFAVRQGRPWADFGLTLHGWRRAVLEAAGIALAVIGVGTAFIALVVRSPGEPLLTWGSVASYNKLQFTVFLAGYPFHTLLQEFIGRGVIQGSLHQFMPRAQRYVPLLLTSALFGVYHLYVSVPFALLTVAISMLFGWLYDRHRTLAGVTLLHAAIGVASTALGLN